MVFERKGKFRNADARFDNLFEERGKVEPCVRSRKG
jgi:hypothetical protein